ncbi:MAG: hypothetical protein WBM62_22035 [Crocosphaera sp.]
MQEFGLTSEQTTIMFSFQYYLVLADIEAEENSEKQTLKKEWLSQWKTATEFFLNNQVPKNEIKQNYYQLIIDNNQLENNIKEIKNEVGNKLSLYLILLEVTLFKPYYPLGSSNDKKNQDLTITNQKKSEII